MLGKEQMDWLIANLEASRQTWKVIGNQVSTRAKLITSKVECKRQCGGNWATREVTGNVLEVVVDRSKKHASHFIKAAWDLGEGHIKANAANICSMKAVAVMPPEDVLCEATAVMTRVRVMNDHSR